MKKNEMIVIDCENCIMEKGCTCVDCERFVSCRICIMHVCINPNYAKHWILTFTGNSKVR